VEKRLDASITRRLWYRSIQQDLIDEEGGGWPKRTATWIDGSLPRHQAELLEWHLEGCGPCVAFVRTYKGTVDAARRLRETTLPPELKEKLRAFLKRSVQQ